MDRREAPPVIMAPVTVIAPSGHATPEEREDANTYAAGKREDAQTTTAGQRRVNLIWEHVQAYLAVYVITMAIIVSGWLVVMRPDAPIAEAAFLFITNTASGIVGFYFSRTNHAAIGGIGAKPEGQTYEGR